MNLDNKDLAQAFEQLARMHRAIAALRADLLPKNPRKFSLLAEGPLDEIRNLREQIDILTGIAEAEELDADVWVHIMGPEAKWPDTSTIVLTGFLDSLRKGVTTVAEYLSTGQLTARPTDELLRACDLRIVGLRTGSLRFGVRLPEEELALFPTEGEASPRKALNLFLSTARWAGSEDDEAILTETIRDDLMKRIVLNAVKSFAPRPRGEIKSLELTGRAVPQGRPILLSRRVSKRIDQIIDQMSCEKAETHTGDLREIDLDKLSFILRNTAQLGDIHCNFEQDLISAAKQALDRRVKVAGIRRIEKGGRATPPLHITRIEITDGDGGKRNS